MPLLKELGKAELEILKAKENIEDAEQDLERAERHLEELLKKYHLADIDEKNVSDLLPTGTFLKGIELFESKQAFTLRDKAGNDLKTFSLKTSLTELFEICAEIERK